MYNNYNDELETEQYLKDCLRLSPIERMKYVEDMVARTYKLMPAKAKEFFENTRWGDITDKF